jgi:tetratricopeptide (TPR) repeat protein
VLVNSHSALSHEAVTLAERLRERGWSTGAVVASGILRARYGLGQGFDRYRDDLLASTVGATSGRSVAEARADQATDAAIAWLGERADDERAFLFLHLIDPHAPYDAPSPFRSRFADAPYLGEVAFADAQVGRLVDELARRGWLERTLLVITSDHGEHLGAHGVTTHGTFLYDEVLRVPLLVRGPGFEPGRVIETPTTLADVVPTVLDALALPTDSSLPGVSLLGTHDPERRILSVSYMQRLLHGWSPLWSWRGARDKLLRAPRPRLFQLDVDPGEQRDVADAEPARARELLEQTDARARALQTARYDARPVALDELSRAQLEALGYAARSGASGIDDPLDFSGPDPHAMMEAYAASSAYMTARVMGELDEASRLLDTARALDPGSPLLVQERGLLLVLQERYAEVLDWYGALDDAARASPDAGLHYGRALNQLGRHAEAEQHLRAAARLHPNHPGTRLELARGLSGEGRLADALAVYDELIEREPRSELARYARCELLARMGRDDEATAGLEELVRIAPGYPPGFLALGQRLAAAGRTERALALLEQYVRLAPHSPKRGGVEQLMVRLKLADEP